MKLQSYSLLFLVFGSLFLLANSGGRAKSGGSGATLAPGDGPTTCANSSCHGSNNFGTSLGVTVANEQGDAVTEYTLGESYTVTVNVNHASGTPAGYGFQVLALDASNTAHNGWDDSTLPTQTGITTLSGKDYFEHRSLRSASSASIKWTAPTESKGDITFYAAGISANGNGTTGGDGGNTTAFVLPQAVGSNTIDVVESSLVISPNPATTQIQISITDREMPFSILDMNGRVVMSGQSIPPSIDIQTFKAGLYNFRVSVGSTQISQAFSKL